MSDTGERVLALAGGWIGTPYRHQASLKGSAATASASFAASGAEFTATNRNCRRPMRLIGLNAAARTG